jgi:hypothetical protein
LRVLNLTRSMMRAADPEINDLSDGINTFMVSLLPTAWTAPTSSHDQHIHLLQHCHQSKGTREVGAQQNSCTYLLGSDTRGLREVHKVAVSPRLSHTIAPTNTRPHSPSATLTHVHTPPCAHLPPAECGSAVPRVSTGHASQRVPEWAAALPGTGGQERHPPRHPAHLEPRSPGAHAAKGCLAGSTM